MPLPQMAEICQAIFAAWPSLFTCLRKSKLVAQKGWRGTEKASVGKEFCPEI
jgi:hypothetical protein